MSVLNWWTSVLIESERDVFWSIRELHSRLAMSHRHTRGQVTVPHEAIRLFCDDSLHSLKADRSIRKFFEPVESNLFSSIMRAFGSAGHFRFCWSAWCEADRKKAHGRGQTVGQTVNNTHNETLSVRSVRLAKTVCNTHCVCHQNSKRESDRKRQATLPKQAPDSAAINQIRLPQWAYLNCLLSCK